MAFQSDNRKPRPALRVKKKGGAPKGNRNALKHRDYTGEKLLARRAFRREIRALILRVRVTVARANFATLGQKPKVTVTRIDVTPSPHRPNS